MPTYLVRRTVGNPSEDDVRAMVERDRALREHVPEIRWVRSYYSAQEGKLYCEYEAPNLQLLTAHLERVGVPVDSAKVVENLEPSMFW